LRLAAGREYGRHRSLKEHPPGPEGPDEAHGVGCGARGGDACAAAGGHGRGGGAEVLLGGDGNDTIDARDAALDERIDCGSGVGDVVNADLVDRPLFIRPFGPSGCESRLFFASDDGPPKKGPRSAVRSVRIR
jgi:hypothetical protein